MKFLVTNELKNNRDLKFLILFLLIGMLLFLIFDILNHDFSIGLNYYDISNTILGNEEAFIEPILLQSLLQIIHVDIFFSIIILLLLSLIYLRVNKQKSILIHVVFISSLFSHFALFFIYWLGTKFIFIWLILFILWHLIATFMIIVSCWKLFN